MVKFRTLCAVLVSMLVVGGCGGANGTVATDPIGRSVPVADGNYMNVSAPELQTMLAKKDFPLVNVHIPFEGNIVGTDLSIPYDQIEQQLDELPTEKNARIVLYCRTGRMSEIAAEALVKRGYTNVFNLDGGMVAWEQAGLQLEGQ